MRHCPKARLRHISVCLLCTALLGAICYAQGLASSDLSHLRSVGGVVLSHDGRFIAYAIVMRYRPGRPYEQLWVMDVSSGKSVRLGGDRPAGSPLCLTLNSQSHELVLGCWVGVMMANTD